MKSCSFYTGSEQLSSSARCTFALTCLSVLFSAPAEMSLSFCTGCWGGDGDDGDGDSCLRG